MPTDLTQLGLSVSTSRFDRVLEGTRDTGNVDGEVLDAVLAQLAVRHYFQEGWSAELTLPTGAVGYDAGSDTRRQYITGLGDIRLAGRYDFSALWGAGGFKPSVILQLGVDLPTGQQATIDDPNSDAPPSILSIGAGSFGLQARVEATQFVHRIIAVQLAGGVLYPTTPGSDGTWFGSQLSYTAGALVVATDWLVLAPQINGRGRAHARKIGEGRQVNSGGHWISAGLTAAFRFGDRLTLTATGSVPFFTQVNGRQLTETFSLNAGLVVNFGGEAEHDHGEEHDHGDAHGHGEEHEDGPGHGHDDAHDPAGEHSDPHQDATADPHVGEHAGDAGAHPWHPEAHGPATGPGDVADAATGGESFVRAEIGVPGKITVVDFWADWCEPCKDIDVALRRLASTHGDLAVRRVEVPDFDSPVAREHLPGVAGLPVVWILTAPDAEPVVLQGINAERLLAELDRLVVHNH